jgi:hypothetical protein
MQEPVSGTMEIRNLLETYDKKQHHPNGWGSDDKKKR